MTGDVARATAWLDRLAEAHEAATPGVWQHDPSEPDTVWGGDDGVVTPIVATTRARLNAAGVHAPEADAAAIVAAHNALPALLALARGVAGLRDDLRRDSARYLGRVQRGGYDDGAIRAYDHIADKLAALLADAAPDEEAR